MPKIFVLMTLALLAVSCASSGDVNRLASRVAEQDERQRRMQSQITSMEQELNRMLSEMETPMRSTQANLRADIEAMRIQTATMQGQMEELHRTMQGDAGGAISDLARHVDHLDRSVTMIASQLAMDIGPRPGDERPASAMQTLTPEFPTEPVRPEMGDDPAKALYDGALQAFNSRNYTQAQKMWDEFARTFPQHELLSNAIFWQGEAFFQMGDYAQAVLAYQDVISKHPNSNKYAASMLKQGVCFFRLDKDRAGVLVLEDLIRRFPNLPEAARAKTILDERKR